MRKIIFYFLISIYCCSCGDDIIESYALVGQNFYDKYEHLINVNKKPLMVISIEDIPKNYIDNTFFTAPNEEFIDPLWSIQEAISNITNTHEVYFFLSLVVNKDIGEETLNYSSRSKSLKKILEEQNIETHFDVNLAYFALLSDNGFEPIYLVVHITDAKKFGSKSTIAIPIIYNEQKEAYFKNFSELPFTNAQFESVFDIYFNLYNELRDSNQLGDIEFLGFDIINVKDNCPNYITEPCDINNFVAPITYQ